MNLAAAKSTDSFEAQCTAVAYGVWDCIKSKPVDASLRINRMTPENIAAAKALRYEVSSESQVVRVYGEWEPTPEGKRGYDAALARVKRISGYMSHTEYDADSDGCGWGITVVIAFGVYMEALRKMAA